ncbi:MAG: EamA family transporter [Candidatus Nomurabacteria bacterium]|nr:EamA family transporter [Candidatus Nomurabacteria bacterium]USN87913.1 MAG: EamA family transporter [Candidatus Nomurabacteria bacterium]
MTWFFIALIGPFLYALTNHLDKILLEKYFKVSGVGTLLLFSSLLSILALPILFTLDPTVLSVDLKSAVALSVVSVLNILVLLFYFLALKDDEASITIVFYQLVPVFGYILGYFVLGEQLTTTQLLAMAIIIFGTSIISIEIDSENNFKLRKKTIALMTAASFFWALGSVIFKYVALEENVIKSLFWEHLMLTVIGVGIFIFIKEYRKHFITAFKQNSRAIISLNVLNEVLYMSGNAVFAFAYMLAPISLILLTQSFQSIFVLIIGIILTIFFRKISVENIHVKYIFQKLLAIFITGIGTYILLLF